MGKVTSPSHTPQGGSLPVRLAVSRGGQDREYWGGDHTLGSESGSGGTCPVFAVSTSPGEPDSELQAVPSSKTGELKDMWRATSVMALAPKLYLVRFPGETSTTGVERLEKGWGKRTCIAEADRWLTGLSEASTGLSLRMRLV